jgi:hypothetical protein
VRSTDFGSCLTEHRSSFFKSYVSINEAINFYSDLENFSFLYNRFRNIFCAAPLERDIH